MSEKVILFVGPLPPPVHGFSEINRRMLTRLQVGSSVKVFDVTPRGGLFHLPKLWMQFAGAAGRACGGVLYLPLSGGLRQFVDACFAGVALLCGFRIFVHHHSFAYLNQRPFYARVVLGLLRKSVHIVLCDRMGDLLASQYSISEKNIRVISNAAFLSELEKPSQNVQRKEKLVLGFLSNITAAKGCFDFVDLLKAGSAQGLAVEGVMAGPVQAEIQAEFADAVTGAGCIRHVGSVYGEEKIIFFTKIDVLVFPTRYANEAEPVTIWEAMGAGVPVISLSRGCISGMVANEVGWVIQDPDNFVELAIEKVRCLLADAQLLQDMKLAARAEFESSKLHYTNSLIALIDEITGIEV